MTKLQQQHDALYDYFRGHYEVLSERCQSILDDHLFQLLKHLHLAQSSNRSMVEALIDGGEVSREVSKLIRALKEAIITYLLDYLPAYERKLQALTGIKAMYKPTAAWDSVLGNLDGFVKRFGKQVMDAARSTPDSMAFNSLFPVEKGKGRYHARLKTLCYMTLLYACNAVTMDILHQCDVKAVLVDDEGVMTQQGEDGLFHLPVAKSEADQWLWQHDGKRHVVGEVAPSHFGSHEIALPYTTR